MNRKTLVTLLAAVTMAALLGRLTLVFASLNASGTHQMPDGSRMITPEMPMSDTHTMGDGSTMNGGGQQ